MKRELKTAITFVLVVALVFGGIYWYFSGRIGLLRRLLTSRDQCVAELDRELAAAKGALFFAEQANREAQDSLAGIRDSLGDIRDAIADFELGIAEGEELIDRSLELIGVIAAVLEDLAGDLDR